MGLLGTEAVGLSFSFGEAEEELLFCVDESGFAPEEESVDESMDESVEELSIVSFEEDEIEESVEEFDALRESAAQATPERVKESANSAMGINFNFFIFNTPFFSVRFQKTPKVL